MLEYQYGHIEKYRFDSDAFALVLLNVLIQMLMHIFLRVHKLVLALPVSHRRRARRFDFLERVLLHVPIPILVHLHALVLTL